MKIKKITYSSHFAKAFKALPEKIKNQAIQKENIFRANCFDTRLKSHKLKGKLKEYWSFSINYSYRILFEFGDDGEVGFIDIGTHSIYS
jgi:mRNA-degrading endonuclease YafQ of YafQ-DinJ toxin-antitoxin module